MSNITFIQDENFKEEVLDSKQLVMVDFYAEWCMPCKMLAPILEEVANESSDKVKVVKLNVDSSKDMSSKYKIMGVPSMLFFKDGKEIDRIVGLRGKEDILGIIDRLA